MSVVLNQGRGKENTLWFKHAEFFDLSTSADFVPCSCLKVFLFLFKFTLL